MRLTIGASRLYHIRYLVLVFKAITVFFTVFFTFYATIFFAAVAVICWVTNLIAMSLPWPPLPPSPARNPHAGGRTE